MVQDQSVELDRKSRKILDAINKAERDPNIDTVTTTILKRRTGIDSQPLLYRLRESGGRGGVLEEVGFVETHQPAGDGGRIPPKHVSLTDEGREYIGQHADNWGDLVKADDKISDHEERLTALEARNRDLRGRVAELERQNELLMDVVDAMSDDNGDLVDVPMIRDGFIGIERYLEQEARAVNLQKYHPKND